eukprot:83711-Prymnesium_polylepis.1
MFYALNSTHGHTSQDHRFPSALRLPSQALRKQLFLAAFASCAIGLFPAMPIFASRPAHGPTLEHA